MKKLVVIFMLIFACISACDRTKTNYLDSDGGRLKIAVVLKTLSSTFWRTVEAGCDEAAAKYGVELIKLGPPTEDAVEQQINMVQDVLAQGIDALVFSPSQPSAAVAVLRRAKAAGIPVILIDTPMPETFTDYVTFIGTENYSTGVQVAAEIMTQIPLGSKVVIIEGAPGNPVMSQRADGAEKAFRDNGYIIASRQSGYSDRERAFTVMQNILQSTPDVAAVFSANDEMAHGAYRAISQAGKRAVVVGVDGNQDAIESVIAGELYGTLAQRIKQMGYLGVENAVKAIKGEIIEKYIDSGTDMIIKANARQFLNRNR
ncbi:MAG: sugar ABC transporter substrate-binding protein [Treponema sp.]|jgi:ribose transport system substrate-binding protein|nr:sugar ABC transporter substrate-binding protein [Treponema sp.]